MWWGWLHRRTCHFLLALVFPVVMYECESWTIKKAECWRIDAFELWYWGRLLRVPWTARRSNQSVIKEISPEYSLEGLMLKLKLQHFGHLMWRTDSSEKTLMLRKIEDGRRRGQQRMRWLDGITQLNVWVSSRSCWWTGRPGVLQSLGSQRLRHDWGLNWTELSQMAWTKVWFFLTLYWEILSETSGVLSTPIVSCKTHHNLWTCVPHPHSCSSSSCGMDRCHLTGDMDKWDRLD